MARRLLQAVPEYNAAGRKAPSRPARAGGRITPRQGRAAEGVAPGLAWTRRAAAFGGGLAAGDDLGALGRFVAGRVATRDVGQFLWNAANGRLSWDAEGTGAGDAVVVAILPTGLALTAGEITVIA